MATIDEIIIRKDGEIVLVEKVLIGSAVAYSRRSILIGDDYTNESESIRLICGLIHSEAYLGIPVSPPSPPNWDGFNAYMLTDQMFKAYRDIVRPIDGDLNGALLDAYGLVSTNGVAAFDLVWGYWCQVSSITVDDRDVIANTAQSFNLPANFVSTIRG